MAEITQELEPLFDYRRVQPFNVISIDDDDDDELDSRAKKKAKKDSKPAVEKADVSAKVVTVIEEDEEDWLIPAPKVARPALADNSILETLRLQKQELESVAKSAENMVRDLEESARRELFSTFQTSPNSKAAPAPAPKPQVERNKVVICIQGKDDNKQQFRVFVDDKLDRVFKMYADKVMIDIQRLVFKFDGDKIAPNATPQSLDMEDQDIIEVHDTSNKKGAPSTKKTR